MTEDHPTKRCPWCAEEILEAAVKCKHCGEYLTEEGERPHVGECLFCGQRINVVPSGRCPNCGVFEPFETDPPSSGQLSTTSRSGPPTSCSICGGVLKKGLDAPDRGSGCIVMILGLLLTPVLIGIPIVLVGVAIAAKREGFWRCKNCGMKFPREAKWYEK